MSLEPRARAADPDTSKRAAVRMRGLPCRSHYQSILGVLYKPLIPPEIARLTGLTVVQVDRRRKELIDRGEIRLTGRERDGYQEWERTPLDGERMG